MSDPHAYVILVGPTPDGHYGAWAPDLPGCIALGDTVEETEREMRDAIAFHLDGLREDEVSYGFDLGRRAARRRSGL